MISAQTVKELRDQTGAGMADCKKALEESQGDMQEAIEWLRKRGAASAAKRSDREANEGIVVAKTSADGKIAAIVEVNCETDFVARNDEFVNYANAICDAVLANDVKSEDELWTINVGGKTLGNLRDEILAKFSERIGLRRFERIETNGHITDYIHAGNRLAVLVEFDAPSLAADAVKGMARDVAMQVAAMQPQYVNRESVDTAAIAKEIEIYKQQAIQEGKKEDIAERIANGRLEKFYQEVVLIEQTFVKDPSRTVKDILADLAKSIGSDVKVRSFRRYYLGEQ
ncbi:MAG TPA: elongation factor Ts [Bacteroidetes bacterium]|nr:elongation factor Ts [Bacteroidota bacterium]HRK05988.1 translation elongation factor Ts [Chlorobiota bacterium]